MVRSEVEIDKSANGRYVLLISYTDFTSLVY